MTTEDKKQEAIDYCLREQSADWNSVIINENALGILYDIAVANTLEEIYNIAIACPCGKKDREWIEVKEIKKRLEELRGKK